MATIALANPADQLPRPKPGRGSSRLTNALAEIEGFPVLSESRDSLTNLFSGGVVVTAEAISTVEADVGLMITALRLANNPQIGGQRHVATIPIAIDVIGLAGVFALARSSETFALLGSSDRGGSAERFRSHALAVQGAADALAKLTGSVDRDQLAVASLLHDLGALAIARLWPERNQREAAVTRTPEQRIRDESKKAQIDHALLGGVLARRWCLPESTACAIERHHAEDATGLAAHVALADMLVHYRASDAIDPGRMRAVAGVCGLPPDALRALVLDGGGPEQGAGRTGRAPCPLTNREIDVLRKLSQGMVSKQIALELELSVSTVRTHLHNAYSKMEVTDRAHAVLSASRLGWI